MYYHNLHNFMNEQIRKIHAIKAIRGIILDPYKDLLDWLSVGDTSLEPRDLGAKLHHFCESVNKIKTELKNPERTTKVARKRTNSRLKAKRQSKCLTIAEEKCSPGPSPMSPPLMGDLKKALARKSQAYPST